VNLDLENVLRKYRCALAVRYDEAAEEFAEASYAGSRYQLGKSLVRAAFALLAEMVVVGHITVGKRNDLLDQLLSEMMDNSFGFDDPIWSEVNKLGWAKGK